MSNDPTKVTPHDATSEAVDTEPEDPRSPEQKAKARQEFFEKLAKVKESITEGVITCW